MFRLPRLYILPFGVSPSSSCYFASLESPASSSYSPRFALLPFFGVSFHLRIDGNPLESFIRFIGEEGGSCWMNFNLPWSLLAVVPGLPAASTIVRPNNSCCYFALTSCFVDFAEVNSDVNGRTRLLDSAAATATADSSPQGFLPPSDLPPPDAENNSLGLSD